MYQHLKSYNQIYNVDSLSLTSKKSITNEKMSLLIVQLSNNGGL